MDGWMDIHYAKIKNLIFQAFMMRAISSCDTQKSCRILSDPVLSDTFRLLDSIVSECRFLRLEKSIRKAGVTFYFNCARFILITEAMAVGLRRVNSFYIL
jgi:hypothetical protein